MKAQEKEEYDIEEDLEHLKVYMWNVAFRRGYGSLVVTIARSREEARIRLKHKFSGLHPPHICDYDIANGPDWVFRLEEFTLAVDRARGEKVCI